MRCCRNISCLILGSMVFMMCPRAFAVSAAELEEMSASGMLTAAREAVGTGKNELAITYLTEYLDRMKDSEDERVLALMQEVRLKLGKISVYLSDSQTAVDYLEQYTDSLPLYKPREAFKLLAVNLYELCQYEDCIAAATQALTRPLPKNLPKREEKVDYDELSKDDTGGLTARQLKRYEEQEKEAGEENAEDIAESLSERVPDPEPDYTTEELVQLNMTLAEAYFELEQWNESLEHFQYVVDYAEDQEHRGYAILKMVNALVELEKFDDARNFITNLCRTEARYDIRVNMALMEVASAFTEAKEYDSALVLLRLVLSRDDLMAYQEQQMNALRREVGLPDMELSFVTNKLGRVETLFGSKKSNLSVQSETVAPTNNSVLTQVKPLALIKLEELVATLVELPPYERDVLYQLGQVYAKMGRPWEAVAAFNIVMEHDPEDETGQRAFVDSLMVLLDPLQEYERVERLGMEYLETHMTGLTPRQVAYTLTMCYQKQELWSEIKKLFPIIRNFEPAADLVIHQYDCELDYMQAIADMMLLEYKAARSGFAEVLEKYKGMHQIENATYWHAMCQLFLQDYAAARSEFIAYTKRYDDGTWFTDTVFRLGICQFGLENYDEAKARFTQVIDTWPKSTIYPDARSMRGDLLASEGLLADAQLDYEEAIATARDVRQGTYPVFQMTAMFELEQRYDEILTTVQTYLDKYGEEADIAKAAFWIGKTKLAQGLTDDAVEAYQDAIVEYGGLDVRQDGVDLIIKELVEVARTMLDNEQRRALKENLEASLSEAESVPLQLRLRVLMASIEERQLELGRQLIDEIDDLEQAPPPVLALICDASFENKNYTRGEEILTLFLNRYEDSEYMNAAYKLRCFQLFKDGQYAEAIEISDEVQELYGTASDAAWAQIMRGRAEHELGLMEDAHKTFRDIFSVRNWRGEPCAEAAFRLGELEEKGGLKRDAFGWYQRCYFIYKAYAEGYWAAEGYLASARCLEALGLENDRRNTFRAMLYDPYVNKLPQVEIAKQELGPAQVEQINAWIAQGFQTNLTVKLEVETVPEVEPREKAEA